MGDYMITCDRCDRYIDIGMFSIFRTGTTKFGLRNRQMEDVQMMSLIH